MTIENGASALRNPAALKKVAELFYVTHPSAPRALLGPFLSEADAECGRLVMRSAGAVVTSALVDRVSDSARFHGENNGAVCRLLAARLEVAHD